jgi:hypothetical protein
VVSSSFTAPIAAKILRISPQTLADLTKLGLIASIGNDGGWLRYDRDVLEQILERQISAEDFATAVQSLAPRPAAHQRFNAKRRSVAPTN